MSGQMELAPPALHLLPPMPGTGSATPADMVPHAAPWPANTLAPQPKFNAALSSTVGSDAVSGSPCTDEDALQAHAEALC